MKTRILFATDVHGSELTFRKFLSAGVIYKANVLLVGGDLTGKMIVPIIKETDDSFRVNWPKEAKLKESEVEGIEKEIRNSGFYPYRTTPTEYDELSANKMKMDELFGRLMSETVTKWCELAEEHLRKHNLKCYLQPGNDDYHTIDTLLDGWGNVTNPEGKVIRIDDQHEMISTGYTNITPWNCPRDTPEDELYQRIERMASQVTSMEKCIFNFHCPPYDSGLDEAPELDAELKMKAGGMGVATKSVGSTAVRKAIEKYQPLLSLHGHIHESRGHRNIGRTLCINPGSEYSQGILTACIIDLTEKGVKNFMLTSG